MIDRLLYFTYVDIGSPSGPGVNEFEFTSALARRFGRKAVVMAPWPQARAAHLEDMDFRPFSLPPLRNLRQHLAAQWRLYKDIKGLAEQGPPLMVARLAGLPLAPWLAASRNALPVAIKTLGLPARDVPPPTLKGKALHPLVKAMRRSLLRRVLAVDTVSDQFAVRLKELCGDGVKVAVIPNATDPQRFRPGLPKPEAVPESAWPVLGYAGGFPSQRGAAQMVEVAARLLPDYPDLTLLVAGDDPEMPGVIQRARDLDISGHCRFLGLRPYEDVPGIINAMDICFSLRPDKDQGDDRVGFSAMKVTQYLACGKPVISIPHNHEFLLDHDVGSLVPHQDIDAMEAAVRAWINRLGKDGRTIGTRARQLVLDEYTTDRALERRLHFWAEALGSSR